MTTLCNDASRKASPCHPHTNSLPIIPLLTCLIRLRGLLTHLQLLQVPVARLHVPLRVIHALREVLSLVITARTETLLLCLLRLWLLLLLLDRLGRSTAEHAADGMADGRADCDATFSFVSFVGYMRVGKRCLRSGAGHLAEETRLRTLLGRRLLRGVGGRGGRARLLGRRCRGRSGGAAGWAHAAAGATAATTGARHLWMGLLGG